MKKLFIYSLLSVIVFFSGLLTINHMQAAKQTNLIEQSYHVVSVHNDYIEAESDKYKNELINFYYDDQTKKESFKVNDKVVASFKPYKNDYQIVDFKKSN